MDSEWNMLEIWIWVQVCDICGNWWQWLWNDYETNKICGWNLNKFILVWTSIETVYGMHLKCSNVRNAFVFFLKWISL